MANFMNPAVCSSDIDPVDSSPGRGWGSGGGGIDEDGLNTEKLM
jgi:hypothetical protein